MSRRDTIIIALLINAGLLAILFMLAVNVDDDVSHSTESSSHIVMEKTQEGPVEVISSSPYTEVAVTDEVDTFLKELKSNDSPQHAYVDDEDVIMHDQQAAPLTKPTTSPSNFAQSTESSQQGNESYIEVKVKSGDALEKIARNNGTTIEAIKQANNLSSTKLSIGQVLKIPTKGQAVATPAKPAQKAVVASSAPVASQQKPALTPAPKTSETKPAAGTEPQYYTVKSGDSPWKIAKEMQISVEDLLRLNNLDEAKARNLKVGEKIRVR